MKVQISIVCFVISISNLLASSSKKGFKASHTEKYFEKFKKDEKEANRLIQRAIIAATKKKDTKRLKIGRQHLYEAMHKKTSIDGYLNTLPTGSSHHHTPYAVYMPNDYKLAELANHKVPTYTDLTFDINHMLKNANLLKMKSDQLKHKANILEHEASLLDATRKRPTEVLPMSVHLDKRPAIEENEVVSPEPSQTLVTTSPHEEEHKESEVDPMRVNHAVETAGIVSPSENNAHSSPHIVTISKEIQDPNTQHVEVSNSHTNEPNTESASKLVGSHISPVHLANTHHGNQLGDALPLIDIDQNQRTKSGHNGQGPERGGSANTPTIPAILTNIKEGPTKVIVDAGFPVYHIPSTDGETSVTEFEKPVPPRDGVNPYEVLTSSSLKRPLLATTVTHVNKVVEPAPLVQNFVKSYKLSPSIPKFVVHKVNGKPNNKRKSKTKMKLDKKHIVHFLKYIKHAQKRKHITHSLDYKKKSPKNRKYNNITKQASESKSHFTHGHKDTHKHTHAHKDTHTHIHAHNHAHNHGAKSHESHSHGFDTFGSHKLSAKAKVKKALAKTAKFKQTQAKKIKAIKQKFLAKKTKKGQMKTEKKKARKKSKH